jgi:hypothetical protein
MKSNCCNNGIEETNYQNLACSYVYPNSVVWQISGMKYQPVVMLFTMTLHPGPSLMKDPPNVNELFSFLLCSRVSVAVHYRLYSSLSFLITMLPYTSFKVDLSIHPFATSIALGQVSQSYNTKAMFHHKQFYKTYINSVNKPITMINQLHNCKYYNRIKIIFLSYSTPPFTSNI